MPGSATPPGRAGACDDAPFRVAFRSRNSVGAQDFDSFVAQWLAYAFPCQRFDRRLTATPA